MGLVDGGQGGAPVHRAEPAGVAVGEDVDPVLARLAGGFDQPAPVLADRFADGDVLVCDQGGLGIGGGAPLGFRGAAQAPAHALDGPAQVHRRRPGGFEHCAGPLQRRVRGVLGGSQGHAIGRRRADQGRAADRHVGDGGGRSFGAGQAQGLQPVGQAALVDDPDIPAPFVQPDGAEVAAVDTHGPDLAVPAQPVRSRWRRSRARRRQDRVCGAGSAGSGWRRPPGGPDRR